MIAAVAAADSQYLVAAADTMVVVAAAGTKAVHPDIVQHLDTIEQRDLALFDK